MHVGQTCSLFVILANPKRVFVVAGIVRWARGAEYGIETLIANGTTQARLAHQFRHRAQESCSLWHEQRSSGGSGVPLILWTPLRHNQPKEVSDGYAATEVLI